MEGRGCEAAPGISEGKHSNQGDWLETGAHGEFRAVESQQQRNFTKAGEPIAVLTVERHKRIRFHVAQARRVSRRAFFIFS